MGDRNNSYQDFLNDLHQKDGDADDCRYGVYDYDYQFNPDGAEATFKSKIFLMSWCPDSSKIKKKMLYSSSFDTLKRGGAHWANSMGDPRVLSNFLNWLVWCCFQCLKVGGAYIWKVPTFSNSFVLFEGNKEHIKRPWRNPFRICINCISLVSKIVFVPLAAQLGWM